MPNYFHLSAAEKKAVRQWLTENSVRPTTAAYKDIQRQMLRHQAPRPKSLRNARAHSHEGVIQYVPGSGFSAALLPVGCALLSDWNSAGSLRLSLHAGASLVTLLWNNWSLLRRECCDTPMGRELRQHLADIVVVDELNFQLKTHEH